MILKQLYGFLRKNLCMVGTMDLTKVSHLHPKLEVPETDMSRPVI
jgi:hypothetical protein